MIKKFKLPIWAYSIRFKILSIVLLAIIASIFIAIIGFSTIKRVESINLVKDHIANVNYLLFHGQIAHKNFHANYIIQTNNINVDED